eukprot:SAG11_NODE_32693_length_281_cov_1.406593_1_plen_58_part_10
MRKGHATKTVWQTGPERSVAPHEVTEKYREFVVSCLRVEMNEMSEQMMSQNLWTLRQH